MDSKPRIPAMSLRALLAAAPLASTACLAASFAGVEVPAPLPVKNVVETYHGVKVDDPYRYFEDVKDPQLQAWMKAEADATAAILARLPGRDPLLARIKELESKAP